MAYVELEGVTKTFVLPSRGFRKSVLKAVNDVSFEIPAGKTFGLVGESGSGKSTIARMILGILPLDGGRISVGGTMYTQRGGKARSEYLRRLSIVFQNPYSSLDPKMNIFQIVSEPMRAFRLYSEAQMADRVRTLLQTVGLSEEHMRRYPHEFSGGQRQRIAIARAISTNPSFLVLDEPTSALDVSVQAKTINLLTKLQAEKGLAYLFISHNLGVVRHISSLIGVMYQGRLLEVGDTDTIIASPAHPYTQYLIAAIPRMGRLQTESATDAAATTAAPAREGCPFVAKCAKRLSQCDSVFPRAAVLNDGHRVWCHLYT